MATYYPPQQLHGETDSVYDTIRKLGGVLYMPPGNANGVNQFVYPDDSTLAGAVAGTPTFDQSGLIPEILGGSPASLFDAAADKVDYTVPLSDPLTMSGGGTWLALLTPSALSGVQMIMQKSTNISTTTRNGFAFFFNGTGIGFTTSSNGTTNTPAIKAGAAVAGESVLLSFTLTAGGAGTLYKNSTSILAQSSLQIPSDTASPMSIGNSVGGGADVDGSIEFAAMIPGVVLTQPQIATIAAQCGPLG